MVKVPDFSGRHACHGHAALFEAPGKRRNAERQEVCNRCPVIPECFAHAIENEPCGYWAGLTPSARAGIRAKYDIRAAFDGNGAVRNNLKEPQ